MANQFVVIGTENNERVLKWQTDRRKERKDRKKTWLDHSQIISVKQSYWKEVNVDTWNLHDKKFLKILENIIVQQ